jgi:phosphate transport system permease protein
MSMANTGTQPFDLSSTRNQILRRQSSRKAGNIVAGIFISLCTLVVLVPLFAIFYYLISNGLSSINLELFTQSFKPVGETGGGLLHAIVGTLELVGMASVIGVLLGVAGGIFLAEYREHKLVPWIRLVSDVLSGIPAIVMGLVVYALLVVTTKKYSGLAGGVALGFLMVPIVVRTTEEVLKLIPSTIREAGLALGLPKWKVIMAVILPAATSGIVTGVMLAVARVSGEAAPLIFTAFGNNNFNANPLEPMAAMPLAIYQYAISPYPEWHRLANAGALVLVVLVFMATLIARLATQKRK